jgi:hypothetical protein
MSVDIKSRNDIAWEVKPNMFEGDKTTKRFILGVSGDNPLICVGFNPSTATEEYADRTLKTVEQIAKNNGYNGWIMLNVYPQRATNPFCLPTDIDWQLHSENLTHISKIFKIGSLSLWAAWGDLIDSNSRPYLMSCLRDILNIAAENNRHWIAFEKKLRGTNGYSISTKKNHPNHPLYMRYNAKSADYDVRHYLTKSQH